MRRSIGGLALILGLLVFPLTARAGGWSVVTLDRSPGAVQAGVPFTIGFMVRQHGQTPMADLSPKITLTKQTAAANGVVGVAATTKGENERVVVTARPEGEIGHYAATITLPSAGTWEWEIDAFGPIAPMSPLPVSAAPAQAQQDQPANATQPLAARNFTSAPSLISGMIAVIVVVIGLLVVRQRRRVGALS